MADNSLNQVVLTALQQVSGSGRYGSNASGVLPDLLPVSSDAFSSAVTEASRQINSLTSANQALIETVLANTQAVIQNSASQGGGKSVGRSIASTIFSSGLGLAPLVSSIVKLVSGGSQSASPPTLLQYVAPPALQLDVADTPGAGFGPANFQPVTYGQNGLPRLAAQDPPQRPASSQGTQISIQVNALDSQSFMDHSYEIAQAVRQAMLNSSSLNDVVSDL